MNNQDDGPMTELQAAQIALILLAKADRDWRDALEVFDEDVLLEAERVLDALPLT